MGIKEKMIIDFLSKGENVSYISCIETQTQTHPNPTIISGAFKNWVISEDKKFITVQSDYTRISIPIWDIYKIEYRNKFGIKYLWEKEKEVKNWCGIWIYPSETPVDFKTKK